MSAAAGSYLAELANLLFLPEDRTRLLCMFAAYFDASGKTEDVKQPGNPVIAVAGYIAPVKAWVRFEKKWKGFLKDFGLTLAHHKEFAHRRGEYTGWSEKTRHDYVRRGAHIINQTVHYGVAAAVLLKDYEKVASENPTERSAFTFVAVTSLKMIGRWAALSTKPGPIAYVFEAGDGHDSELIQARREILDDPKHVEVYRFNSLTLAEKDDENFVHLQAADWLAYETKKYLNDTTLRPEEPRELRNSLLPLLKPDKLLTLWYREDTLRKLRDSIRRGEPRL